MVTFPVGTAYVADIAPLPGRNGERLRARSSSTISMSMVIGPWAACRRARPLRSSAGCGAACSSLRHDRHRRCCAPRKSLAAHRWSTRAFRRNRRVVDIREPLDARRHDSRLDARRSSTATVVNVALPALQADLHATITDVQWVIEAYAPVPRRADPRRRLDGRSIRPQAACFCWACVCFTIASVAVRSRGVAGDRSSSAARCRASARRSSSREPRDHQRRIRRRRTRPGDRHVVGVQRDHHGDRAGRPAAG